MARTVTETLIIFGMPFLSEMTVKVFLLELDFKGPPSYPLTAFSPGFVGLYGLRSQRKRSCEKHERDRKQTSSVT